MVAKTCNPKLNWTLTILPRKPCENDELITKWFLNG